MKKSIHLVLGLVLGRVEMLSTWISKKWKNINVSIVKARATTLSINILKMNEPDPSPVKPFSAL